VATDLPCKGQLQEQKKLLFNILEAQHARLVEMVNKLGYPREWGVRYRPDRKLSKLFTVQYSVYAPSDEYERLMLSAALAEVFELPKGPRLKYRYFGRNHVRFYAPATTETGIQQLKEYLCEFKTTNSSLPASSTEPTRCTTL
jgi:hypothetical protein